MSQSYYMYLVLGALIHTRPNLSELASKLSGALWQWNRKRKESLQLCLWNLNIYIKKVMTSLPLGHVSASFWLAEIWQLSWPEATGELELEFKFQRRCCKHSFPFLPHCQSTLESLLIGLTPSFNKALEIRIAGSPCHL